MTMLAGNVAVADDGTETFTPNTAQNAAMALYLLLLADAATVTTPTTTQSMTPPHIDPITGVTTPGVVTIVQGTATPPGTWPSVDAKKATAKIANSMATWMVSYLQANGVARVGAAVAALQKTPNPNNPATATAASGAAVDLPIF